MPAGSRSFQQDSFSPNEPGVIFGNSFCRRSRSLEWQIFRVRRATKSSNRTNGAAWCARGTNQRAKVNQGRIETGGVSFRDKIGRMAPQFFAPDNGIDLCSDVEKAR